MSLSRAKPLDTLYDEVANYDLVVVPDAPLASALNRRLDRPHLGPFATTPRRLAAGRREEAEDRIAFLELVEETDLGWKQAAYSVGNILQCWEHQGTLDAILSYDSYADGATRTAVDCFTQLDTTSGRLEAYTIEDSASVAVVGIDQLTALERSILPQEYDTFDPFLEEPFDHPEFHIFDTTNAIVERLLDVISGDNAEDVAVVLDQRSEYSTLVESAFEAADIPFYGGPGFVDDPDHRAFVQLLRVAHAGSDTRVSAVRPVLTRLGSNVDIEHTEKRLHEADFPGSEWLTEFCKSVGEYTFETALSAYEDATDTELSAFRDELRTLGIADDRVTQKRIDQFEFYLQTYQVPVNRDNEGVLLADAKSAAYVDRPVVFYVGLDEDWTHSSPQRPWVDTDEEYTRNIDQFQLLLQNGVEQYYLVQDARGGTPVTPCLYFEELLEEEFERFSDLPSLSHSTPSTDSGDGFDRDPVDVECDPVNTISQSSLKTYVNCPRDYFFSRLVDSPEKDYFVEGNLFHDFAEFYVHHPEVADDARIEELVDLILEEARPFLRTVDEDLRRTKYRFGIETIQQFFEEWEHTPVETLPEVEHRGSNAVADYFDRDVESGLTERWFENEDLGIKGKIDLVHASHRLVDYKSGSRKRRTEVVKNAAVDQPSDSPNFQALLYLAHFRTLNPDERLEFTFVHFLETLDDAVRGDVNLDDAITTVTYYPTTFEEYVRSEEVFDSLETDGAKKCQKTLSKASYDDYLEAFETCEFPDTDDTDELIDSDLGRTLEARLKDCVGDYKYVEDGCEQLLRELLRIRSRNFFADDLDAFEVFVDERLDELNRRHAGDEQFPVDGLAGEPNYRYVDHRDLILEND